MIDRTITIRLIRDIALHCARTTYNHLQFAESHLPFGIIHFKNISCQCFMVSSSFERKSFRKQQQTIDRTNERKKKIASIASSVLTSYIWCACRRTRTLYAMYSIRIMCLWAVVVNCKFPMRHPHKQYTNYSAPSNEQPIHQIVE